MEENRNREDFRKVRSAKGGMLFRLAGIAVVLYWLAELVVAYVKGGPDAPSVAMLITACIIMGGGAALVGFLTWKAWKLEKAAAALTEEEIAALDAMREEEE